MSTLKGNVLEFCVPVWRQLTDGKPAEHVQLKGAHNSYRAGGESPVTKQSTWRLLISARGREKRSRQAGSLRMKKPCLNPSSPRHQDLSRWAERRRTGPCWLDETRHVEIAEAVLRSSLKLNICVFWQHASLVLSMATACVAVGLYTAGRVRVSSIYKLVGE